MGKETIVECGSERTDPICYSPFEVDCPDQAGLRRPSESSSTCVHIAAAAAAFRKRPIPWFIV